MLCFIYFRGISETFWVGLTTDGYTFTWDDGTALSYGDWTSAGPDNMMTEQCVTVVGTDNFKLDTRSCHDTYNYICQCKNNNYCRVNGNEILDSIIYMSCP